jgi:hypothetical protein
MTAAGGEVEEGREREGRGGGEKGAGEGGGRGERMGWALFIGDSREHGEG